MRFVCVSDTHLTTDGVELPPGDVLLHAGDLTRRGRPAEIEAAGSWLASLPYAHKVVIAGNHDFELEKGPQRARELLPGVTYLQDDEVTIGGLRIWGSPWQPWFMDWAFNLRRGPAIRAKWKLVPAGVDVLITHGPPAGILDRTERGEPVGCADLLAELERIAPRVHVFGHIHEAAGELEANGIRFVNAAICDVRYRPVQPARVFDLEPRPAASPAGGSAAGGA
jgi:predicted phosphohydrolase